MATLNECKSELSSIITELRAIEEGIRQDFVGIGEGLCGDCINKVAEKYVRVFEQLKSVNQNKFTEWVTGEK